MAKEKKSKEGTSEIDKIIEDEFFELQDISTGKELEPTYHLDTGNYALNYVCSKNLKWGVPSGRISSFVGLSGVGKSLILANLIKDENIKETIIISSEGGGLTQSLLKFVGVPAGKKIRIVPIQTFTSYSVNKENGKIEEVSDKDLPASTETDKFIYHKGLNTWIKKFLYQVEFRGIKDNILILIDSLANIKSVRELSGTADFGSRGRNLNDFFSSIDNIIEKTNTTLVFSNKLYSSMNIYSPYTEVGGLSVIYNPSLTVKLTAVSETEDLTDAQMKEEKLLRKSALGMSQKPIRATISKSRSGTEGRNAVMLLDSTYGLKRLSGLRELLTDFGIIQKINNRTYSVPSIEEFKSFSKGDFISIFQKDENKFIDLFQTLLESKEEEIKQKRLSEEFSDLGEMLDNSGIEIDDSASGIDIAQMASMMEDDK